MYLYFTQLISDIFRKPYVGRTMTMPIKVYLSVLDGFFGTASAMSTILLLVTGLALYLVNRWTGRSGGSIVAMS